MRAAAPTVALLAVALAACGAAATLPDRTPDAVGTAQSVEDGDGVVRVQFAHDAGYEYFEGTVFVVGGSVMVAGAVDAAAEIEAGDRIQVWTGPCAESFPVQCEVEAVEVLDLSS